MYAVIDRGGKQMRVEEGQVLEVDRLAADKGAEVVLGRVLMVVDADNVQCGAPVVEGAQVMVKVLSHGRARKVTVGKFRPKKHYRRRVGHRQPLSRVRIERIELGGAGRGA
jgi:large subunit ribosomal protein L21